MEVCLSLQCLWVILESFSPTSECGSPCLSREKVPVKQPWDPVSSNHPLWLYHPLFCSLWLLAFSGLSLYTIKNTQQPAMSRVTGLSWCPTGASASEQLYFLPRMRWLPSKCLLVVYQRKPRAGIGDSFSCLKPTLLPLPSRSFSPHPAHWTYPPGARCPRGWEQPRVLLRDAAAEPSGLMATCPHSSLRGRRGKECGVWTSLSDWAPASGVRRRTRSVWAKGTIVWGSSGQKACLHLLPRLMDNWDIQPVSERRVGRNGLADLPDAGLLEHQIETGITHGRNNWGWVLGENVYFLAL